MYVDDVAYLDQLYGKAIAKPGDLVMGQTIDAAEIARAKRRFLDIVFLSWPEISATFDDDKHSL